MFIGRAMICVSVFHPRSGALLPFLTPLFQPDNKIIVLLKRTNFFVQDDNPPDPQLMRLDNMLVAEGIMGAESVLNSGI